MPTPYYLKLSAQRMQNLLKRLWEQQRFFQAQHTLSTKRQQTLFNEKMLRLSRTSRPGFSKPTLDEQSTNYFRLRQSKKMQQPVLNDKPRILKTTPKPKPMPSSRSFIQKAYLHLLGFFAKDAQLKKKINQEKWIEKQNIQEKISEQAQLNRLDL